MLRNGNQALRTKRCIKKTLYNEWEKIILRADNHRRCSTVGFCSLIFHLLPSQVHCYCFAEVDTPDFAALKRVSSALYGESKDAFQGECRIVRRVSPKKSQVCISFALPQDVAYLDPEENPTKRRRAET
mmetsp:Transcript_18185/g.26336  ORF Transcript_18185/g.26336 Transcript_18185/m.26336 type:complete len:129 (+) Transcript_18185:1294-1680(+)